MHPALNTTRGVGKTPKPDPSGLTPGHTPTLIPYKKPAHLLPQGVSRENCPLFSIPPVATGALVKLRLSFLTGLFSISVDWGRLRTLLNNHFQLLRLKITRKSYRSTFKHVQKYDPFLPAHCYQNSGSHHHPICTVALDFVSAPLLLYFLPTPQSQFSTSQLERSFQKDILLLYKKAYIIPLLISLQRLLTSLVAQASPSHYQPGPESSVVPAPPTPAYHSKLFSFSLTPCSFHCSHSGLLAALQARRTHFHLKTRTLAVPSDWRIFPPDICMTHSILFQTSGFGITWLSILNFTNPLCFVSSPKLFWLCSQENEDSRVSVSRCLTKHPGSCLFPSQHNFSD